MKNTAIDISNNIYKTIIENLGEEIFVSDGTGKILFVNPASVEVNRIEAEKIIGRNVNDLVKEGLFSESSTVQVLKEKKPVSIVQKLKDGRKVLASGCPLYDDNGEIIMVISTSKDVEAVNQLLNTIDTQDAEIESLREEIFTEAGFISSDEFTKEIKERIKRIAPLDMPILIQGEVGVEKNQAANSIHSFSKRKNAPFINLNCFTIHGSALEIEIFGYEESSPVSGYTEVKKGMLELAHGGTLLISDIEQLPFHIQMRLHGYLETSRFTRTGGTKTIKADTRILATTCSNLKEMSEEGSFLKELYYSLNTVPLHIPPLSKRTGDIAVIARSYISKLNSKYKGNKLLGNRAIGTLTSHDWPGNIKELEHVLESAYILSDSTIINSEIIHKAIHGNQNDNKSINIYCNDIMPLKEAKQELEKQLVLRAYETYKTTSKAADVLKVNQSTVSKILKKYK